MPLSVHEPIQEYAIEPELSSLTPRRLRATAWPIAVIAGSVAAYVLLVACAAIIAVQSIRIVCLAEYGRTTMANVTGCEYAGGGSGSCTPAPAQPIVRFDYQSDEYALVRGSAPVSLLASNDSARSQSPFPDSQPMESMPGSRQPEVSVPTKLIVRFGTWGGKMISCPAQSVSAESSGLSVAVALFIAGIATYLVVLFLRWMKRTIKMLQFGEAVIGTVTSKEIKESDLPRYYVTYGFLDADGAPHQSVERCTPDQWRRLEIGQPITVIYPPAQPSRCELYAHMPLHCAS
jgi:hypothetical protein